MTQTATATIDRAAIMQDAWAMYRRFHHHVAFCAQRFGSELRRAWHKAKMAAANACPIQRTRNAILALESKNQLTQQDYACLGVLRAALRAKKEAATAAGKRAVATRKTVHPNLLPVWDAQAKAPRSINLATVSRIAVDGTVHEYA